MTAPPASTDAVSRRRRLLGRWIVDIDFSLFPSLKVDALLEEQH
jgi:hypothetical protein